MSDKYEPMNAVVHAIEGQPLDFENQVKGLLAQKLQDRVAEKRQEVAQTLFGPRPEDIPDYVEVDPATGNPVEEASDEPQNEPEPESVETPSEE